MKAFPWLFPTPRPGAGNPGLSPDASTPRTRAAEESPGSTRGRGEGRGGPWPGAGGLPAPWEPCLLGAPALAPPRRAPPQGSAGRRSAAARETCLGRCRRVTPAAGGCKPQAKVEREWSFSSNPFYTVKTANLSPRRPLFNWKANMKNQNTRELTFFPYVFFLNKRPVLGRRGRPTLSHVCSLRGLARDTREATPRRGQNLSFSGRRSLPTSRLSTGHAEAAHSMQGHLPELRGRWGGLGVGGSERVELAPDPGSCEALDWKSRSLGRPAGASETSKTTKEAPADVLQVSQFSPGKSRS